MVFKQRVLHPFTLHNEPFSSAVSHCQCVNIVFAFYRILPFKCIAINGMCIPTINFLTLHFQCSTFCWLVCVCVCQNGKYFEFNSIFSAITITKTNKQTDKRNMHYASVAFIVVTLNLVCKHMFDDSIVISFKIIRICIEIWWNISSVIAG